MAAAHENHSVPDAKMVNAWDDEHSAWSILLQVLVLDSQTVIFTMAVRYGSRIMRKWIVRDVSKNTKKKQVNIHAFFHKVAIPQKCRGSPTS